jgi:hypothetical protein
MLAIKLLWIVSNITYRVFRLAGRAMSQLAVVLWREA